MRLSYLSIVMIGAALAAGQARAQEFGDLQQGRALAQQVCAECHAVGPADARSPNALAPRFEAVAATPGMTALPVSGTARPPALTAPPTRCGTRT